MSTGFELHEFIGTLIESWPEAIILLSWAVLSMGAATHLAARFMGAEYSTIRRGTAVVLLAIAADIPFVAIYGTAYEILETYPLLHYLIGAAGNLIYWLIIMKAYRLSFLRSIGVWFLSSIFGMIIGLLLMLPTIVLLMAVDGWF